MERRGTSQNKKASLVTLEKKKMLKKKIPRAISEMGKIVLSTSASYFKYSLYMTIQHLV